jgi:DNA-binding transcriptional ArsR family regulator
MIRKFLAMTHDQMPDVYPLENIEQMRAMADDLRLRVLQLLGHAPMTVTEIGKQLGVPANKTHYHVRELERVGLLRLVETREKGGVLEKYYRAVARDFTIPSALLRGAGADEGLALTDEIAQSILRGLHRAAHIALQQPDDARDSLSVGGSYLWLTRDEYREVMKSIAALLDPYTHPRDVPGAREHTFSMISYVTPPVGEGEAPGDAPPPRAKARNRVLFTAGATGYSRADLEHAVAAGERMDLHALGLVTFADDISADLADRAIGRFRHRGRLIATPEVRAVLARKAGGSQGKEA